MAKKTLKTPIKDPAAKILVGNEKQQLTVTKKAFEAVYKGKGFNYIGEALEVDSIDVDLEIPEIAQDAVIKRGAKRKALAIDD